ncbi:MAG: VCBS repeat-containing protein [Nitrosomonas ureae]
MGKRFWLLCSVLSGLLSWGEWCLAADGLTTTDALPKTTPMASAEEAFPTASKPVWTAPDKSYSRFWMDSGTFHVLVDDLTADGRLDLAFTTHSTGMIHIFRQIEPRHFVAVGEQDIPGFHPNDTIVLPGLPKRYVINGEGIGRLRIVAAEPDAKLKQVAEYMIPGPLGTTPFSWPGWGMSLAVAPYSGSTMTLLRDFNPEIGIPKAVISLSAGRDVRPARLADLKGEGTSALVFPSFDDSKVWAAEYAGPDHEPTLRQLAAFAGGWPRHVLPFDVNRDGKIDLLVPMSVEQRIAVLINDGKGQFSEAESIAYPGSVGIHAMAVGEDRRERYLLAGGIRSLVLYRERPDKSGAFETVIVPLFNWPSRLELVDVDGDGWLDAVVANVGAATSMVVYGPLWEAFNKLAANPPDGAKPD